MRRYTVTIVITLLVLLWVGLATAQSNNVKPIPYVYRIDIKGCKFEPVNRRQTGFRVQGLAGIVTALHGVADCKTIHATADGGQEMFTDLTIQQVDIERDVALLASAELEELPKDGLLASSLSTTEILTATLRIVGYPRGLEKQDIDAIESIRDIESLDDVIPDAEEPADFIKRKSPSLAIDVLNVQAQLLPGHSGAPLIDSADQIVAIGNGGLRSGTEGRSWAIPWLAVDLQTVDVADIQQKLAELAAKDIAALAFSSTYPSQLTDETKLVTYAVRVVDTNQTPIANAEVLLTHSAGYMIGITDSEGFYTFQLPTNASYIQSQIQVQAPGYPLYSRTLSNVLDKVGTEILRLNALRPTSNPISGSICEFAFRILDEASEQPITGATVSVTLGTSPSSGRTDSTGYFGSKLPCADPVGANLRVRVTAIGYKAHAETVPLVGETKEIWLIPLSSPTETPTSVPTASATLSQPTSIATPTSAEPVASVQGSAELVIGVASCNIRSGPDINYPILGTANSGERLTAIGENVDETWWQIEYKGQSGWVSEMCVSEQNIASDSLTPIATLLSTPVIIPAQGQVVNTLPTNTSQDYDLYPTTSISDRIAKDAYNEHSFLGTENVPLLLSLSVSEGNFTYRYDISDPSGKSIARGGDYGSDVEVPFTPAVTGKYTVRITGGSGFGTYGIHLSVIDNADHGSAAQRALEVDVPITAKTAVNAYDEYTFDGTENVPLLLSLSVSEGNFTYRYDISDPSGKSIARGGDYGSDIEVPFTPAVTGKYTVRITGGSGFGTYGIHLTEL